MSEQISISVVIPTYNRADLLVKAVKSVLAQTYPVKEILICDDGSTDDSKAKIDALKSPTIKWMDCGRNGGPAIPRNIGIKHSKGNWIAFLDSDDEWVPTKLEAQVAVINAENCKAVSSNATKILNGLAYGAYLNYKKDLTTIVDLLKRNTVILSSLMVSRDVLSLTPLFPVDKKFNSIEDYVLLFKITAFTNIYFINKELVRYHDEPSLSIRTESPASFYVQRKLATKDLLKWAKERKIRLKWVLKPSIFLCNSWLMKQKYLLVKFVRDSF